jgi:hypothetical protein
MPDPAPVGERIAADRDGARPYVYRLRVPGSRGNLKKDFDEARRRMRVSKPIPPIRDNFAASGGMGQGAVGFTTFAAFLRSWNEVRSERRYRQRKHS